MLVPVWTCFVFPSHLAFILALRVSSMSSNLQLTWLILAATRSQTDRFPCRQVRFRRSQLHTPFALTCSMLIVFFPFRFCAPSGTCDDGLSTRYIREKKKNTLSTLCTLSPSDFTRCLRVCARLCATSDARRNARLSETTRMPTWTGVSNPGEGLYES